MISAFNSVLGRFFDVILYPLRALNPWVAIALLSLLTAVIMLLVYRVVSNQDGIKKTRNRIAAHLLEIRLYQNNMPVTFRAQGSILWWNLKYLMHAMKPMLVLVIPLVLAIINLDLRFGTSPLAPGDSTVVALKLRPGYQPSQVPAQIKTPAGIEVATPPLRIDGEREVDWRLKAKEPGTHLLDIRVGDEVLAKSIVVGNPTLDAVQSARVGPGIFNLLLNPGEPPLPGSSAVQSIAISYPHKNLVLFGFHIHWLVAFFVLSVLFGLGLKGFFKVQI
jgi:hypothetical protein